MEDKTKKRVLVGIVIGVIIIAVIASIYSISSSSSSTATTTAAMTIADPGSLPGLQTNDGPWIAEISQLKARLQAIGLPALSQEGTLLHIHQHLDLYIHGQPVPVPAGLGINETDQFISPIHVHDDTGIIHVESPTIQTYTLGQFFDIWGLKFTATSIGGYSNTGDDTLKVYVNGVLYSGDPRQLALAAHQEIVVAYGTDKELPSPIPAEYIFPIGD